MSPHSYNLVDGSSVKVSHNNQLTTHRSRAQLLGIPGGAVPATVTANITLILDQNGPPASSSDYLLSWSKHCRLREVLFHQLAGILQTLYCANRSHSTNNITHYTSRASYSHTSTDYSHQGKHKEQ